MDGNQSWWHDPLWYIYPCKNSVNSFNSVLCIIALFWALFQAAKLCKLSKKCSCFSSSKPNFYWNQMCFEFSLEKSWSEVFLVLLLSKSIHSTLGCNLGPPWPSLLGHIIFCNVMECSVHILRSPCTERPHFVPFRTRTDFFRKEREKPKGEVFDAVFQKQNLVYKLGNRFFSISAAYLFSMMSQEKALKKLTLKANHSTIL